MEVIQLIFQDKKKQQSHKCIIQQIGTGKHLEAVTTDTSESQKHV